MMNLLIACVIDSPRGFGDTCVILDYVVWSVEYVIRLESLQGPDGIHTRLEERVLFGWRVCLQGK